MTPEEAREFCDGLQERVTQLGDRTSEGQYLGQALGVIRDLASQLDAPHAEPTVALLAAEPDAALAGVGFATQKPDDHVGAVGGE